MDRWLPPNVSTYGGDIDRLFHIIYWITGGVFILVAVALVAFLVMYRDRGDGRRATYTHGNNTLEVIWTIIPTIVFVVLAVMSTKSWAEIKINPPPPDMTVKLHGKQFNWVFTYPGPDGELGTKDDYSQENFLRVPLHKKVRVILTAEDVIHSFFVPQLRLKQDLLPGRELSAWFEATRAGVYEIPCAELCGFGHTTMVGKLTVLDAAEKWSDSDARAVAKGWPKSMQPPAPPAAAPAPVTPEPTPGSDAAPGSGLEPATPPAGDESASSTQG